MPPGCRQAYCVKRLISSPTPKPTSSPTLCSAWWKWEMILLRLGRAKLNGIRKNNHFKDTNRIDGLPTDQESQTDLQLEPKHFKGRIIFMSMFNDIVWDAKRKQRTMWIQFTGSCGYARKFFFGHRSFLRPGSEEKLYGTYTDKPDGSWDQMAEEMMANFYRSGHPIFSCFQCIWENRITKQRRGKEVNTLQW